MQKNTGQFQKALYYTNLVKYVKEDNSYHVFISIDDTKDVAGRLLYKSFKNKFLANLYYRLLEYIITHKKISTIERLVEKIG